MQYKTMATDVEVHGQRNWHKWSSIKRRSGRRARARGGARQANISNEIQTNLDWSLTMLQYQRWRTERTEMQQHKTHTTKSFTAGAIKIYLIYSPPPYSLLTYVKLVVATIKLHPI